MASIYLSCCCWKKNTATAEWKQDCGSDAMRQERYWKKHNN
jgi:hypothetical protein